MTAENLSLEDKSAQELIVEQMIEESQKPRDTIETVISSLQQDDSAMVLHEDNSYVWKFKYGTVEVFVQLTGETEADIFTVWSAVMKLPAKDEAKLMRKLLEMNWSGTFEACFGIFNEQIVVLAQRTVAELSSGEISRAITLVANLADENDEPLMAEFGL